MAKRKSKAQRIRISYNAPVTLTCSLIAAAILIINQFVLPGIIALIFTVPGKIGSEFAFDWKNTFDYVRLFTHVLGHADWSHLIGNLSFILLLGPLLEERYGSGILALMMIVTAFVTGILNVCFVTKGLLGASGIAFMMILLSSFTTNSKNQIPLTFILIMVLYMGRETFAHIAGGLCGSLFGFLGVNSPRKTKTNPPAKKAEKTQTEKTVVKNQNDDETVVISSMKF